MICDFKNVSCQDRKFWLWAWGEVFLPIGGTTGAGNRLRRKNRCTTFHINFQLFIVFTFTFCCSGAKVWSYFILLSVCHQHRVLPDTFTFNFLSEICQAKANFQVFRLRIFVFIFLVWLPQFHFLKRMKLQRLMLITLNQTQRKLPHISLSQ